MEELSTIIVTDEEGNELELEIVDMFLHKGQQYALLIQAADCDDDCDCCEDDYEYSVVCPACNEELLLEDEDIESGVLQCPCCGETLELEFDEDDEEEEEDED